MARDKHIAVLRILDDQNRLTDRADTKAISLLSTLGIFTIFFVAHFNDIPINTVTIILLVIYFITVLMAILQIILAISPRISSKKKNGNQEDEKPALPQPTFFGGIVQYADADEYKKSIDQIFGDDETVTEIYVHQIYEVARINNTKYAHVKRAVWLVVIALTAQIALIALTFGSKVF